MCTWNLLNNIYNFLELRQEGVIIEWNLHLTCIIRFTIGHSDFLSSCFNSSLYSHAVNVGVSFVKTAIFSGGTPELKLPFRGRGGHPVRPAFDSTRWPSDAIPQRRVKPIRAGSAAVCVVAWIRTQRAVHLGSVSKWNCHYSADILALRILSRHSMTFSDVWARMTPVSLTLLKTHQTWKQRHFCRRPW